MKGKAKDISSLNILYMMSTLYQGNILYRLTELVQGVSVPVKFCCKSFNRGTKAQHWLEVELMAVPSGHIMAFEIPTRFIRTSKSDDIDISRVRLMVSDVLTG